MQGYFQHENLSRLSGKKETASEEENDIRTEPTRIEQAKIIDSLALPDLLKTQLAENNNASAMRALQYPVLRGIWQPLWQTWFLGSFLI